MDDIFYLCVMFLLNLADFTGLTYEQVNVILFCILWPAWSLGMVAWVVYLLRKK